MIFNIQRSLKQKLLASVYTCYTVDFETEIVVELVSSLST